MYEKIWYVQKSLPSNQSNNVIQLKKYQEQNLFFTIAWIKVWGKERRCMKIFAMCKSS